MRKIYASLFLFFVYVNAYAQINQNNFDFELTPVGSYTSANAVSGWTVESAQNSTLIVAPNTTYGAACNANPVANWNPGSPEFSIVATPIAPTTNTAFSIDNVIIANSPLGGNRVARLNNSNGNGLVTRISKNFQVNLLNSTLNFGWAGSWDGNVHSCCGQPAMRIDIYNCNNLLTPIPGISGSLTPFTASCQSGVPGYSISNGVYWTNWKFFSLDLTAQIGNCLKIIITVSDCAEGLHHGTSYFDAQLSPGFMWNLGSGIAPTNVNGNNVSFCSGSNMAVINAPSGYLAYQWHAPQMGALSTPMGTSPNLTISPVIAGSIYTLVVTNYFGFTSAYTYTILPYLVNITGIGTSSSCIGGASGSASIVANGSGIGYNYTWLNSNNVTISTNSVVNNLAAGVYSVVVTSVGAFSNSCGSAMSSVTIVNAPPTEISLLKPYCGSSAYLNTPPGGSNFQWYQNFSPYGSAPAYTISNPSNGSIYRVSYTSSLGCHDSLKFTLFPSTPGSITVSQNNTVCPGINLSNAVIHLNPADNSQLGINSFSVFSVGLTPPYSASLNPTSLTNFTVLNLSIGNTYSVQVFDGACYYSSTLTANNVIPPFDFTLNPNASTLCLSNTVAAGVSFSNQQSGAQFTYSWSPPNYLAGTQQQSTIVQNNGNQNPVTNIIYSVVVTPTLANCPLTRTFSVTFINAPTPIINLNQIPNLCNNSPSFTLSAVPSNGYFSGNAVSSAGIIYPNLATLGSPNTFTYTAPGCASSATGSFAVINSTVMSVSGNTSLLSGQSVTLQAFGANSYTWSNGVQSFSNVVSPCVNSVYSVMANDALNNCIVQQSVNVTVQPNLHITGNFSICAGQTTLLQASGANTYTWNTASQSSSIIAAPMVSSLYSVSGTTNNCVTQTSVIVYVYLYPLIHITGNNKLCIGESTILHVSGALSYTWNTLSNNSSITVAPTTQTSYTVLGSNTLNSCSNTAVFTISVNPLPNVTIDGNVNLCDGENVFTTLTGQGADSYSWNIFSNATSILVYPVNNSFYSVIGTNTTTGCKNYASVSVSISDCTGFEEQEKEMTLLTIFPNPSTGLFFIEATMPLSISIYNQVGALVLNNKLESGKTEINLHDFAAGIYFIKAENKSEVLKLIKLD